MRLISELKRRNVLRMAVLYVLAAWLLMQIAEVVMTLAALPIWTGQATLVLLMLGFPIALIFSWFYEITPEGLALEKDVPRHESITHITGRRIDFIVIALLCAAVFMFAVDKWWTGGPPSDSIAVLAFENMSAEPEQEYFSDGISEEILDQLAKVQGLRVTSRSSAFSYKGRDINLSDVARELNVAHILEGSVRKDAHRVRITAQLIDARSDTHLWSETYDRTLDDIFAVQNEIAVSVVHKLKLAILGEPKQVEETDPEAYALFLQARFVGAKGSAESYEQASTLYQQVLGIDPQYSAAWAGLAMNYTARAARGLIPWDEGFALARQAANSALAVDEENAVAHAVLGIVADQHDNDLAVAAKHFERALELEPTNPDIIFKASTLLHNLGHQKEAIALREYLVLVDPVRSLSHYNLGYSYLSAGRWEEAIAAFAVALRLNPGTLAAHYLTGIAFLMKGEPQSGMEQMRLESFEPLRLIGMVAASYALGDVVRSDSLIEEVTEKFPEWAYNFSHMHSFRNENSRAFDWLEKAVELRDPGVSEVVGEVMLTNLHDDPRWLPFLESVGRSPSQLDSVRIDVPIPILEK